MHRVIETWLIASLAVCPGLTGCAPKGPPAYYHSPPIPDEPRVLPRRKPAAPGTAQEIDQKLRALEEGVRELRQ